MTATEARLHTLKEVIDFCKEEQTKCEGEDRWVVIGKSPLCGQSFDSHFCPIETVVEIIEKHKDSNMLCQWNEQGRVRKQYINPVDLENRKHLNTGRYNALQDVIDKCEKLKL